VAVTEIAEVIEGATAEDLVAVAGAVASADLGAVASADLGEAALVAHGVEADRVAAALTGEAIGNAALASTPASRWPCAVWIPTETA
jgi:hypothetical protein